MAKIKLANYTLINKKVFIFLLDIKFLFLYIGYITKSVRNFHRNKRRINPCTKLATFISVLFYIGFLYSLELILPLLLLYGIRC